MEADPRWRAAGRMIEGLFPPGARAGPGDLPSLIRATQGLAPDAVVLDAGCGAGADLPGLCAAVPQGRVVAVDRSPRFIDRIRVADPQVSAHRADMLAPPGGPFDLVWSAGSAYGPGVAACLDAWRNVLKPGGRIALSHLCWRAPAPSPEAQAFWDKEFPGMADLAAHLGVIAACGYRVLDGFWLPDSAWADYYEPLQARLGAAAADPAMASLVAAFAAEIALWRAHGSAYGYWMAVLTPE